MQISRRLFLGGMAAAGAAGAAETEGLLADWAGGPELRLGILSDIHIRGADTTGTFLSALAWFRERGVDGVVIAGDMADHGLVPQLQLVADAWFKVFPGDRGDAGRHVEKLFVYGNHDWEGLRYPGKEFYEKHKGEALANDWGGNWERIFKEPFAPVWTKEVKGYTFIGCHWWKGKEIQAVADRLAKEGKLGGPRPFFFIQHPHPAGTVYGPWAWGAWDDRDFARKALNPFPNAVALSGHSHYSLTDERSVWQGEFTSIGTSSLSYTGEVYGRENGEIPGKGAGDFHQPAFSTQNGRQGMLLTAYADRLVIERREFVYGESLGEDWVLPVPQKGEFAFDRRAAFCKAPEFAAGAKAAVARGKGKNRANREEEQVTVTFPAAVWKDWRDRVFDYEVRAVISTCDVVKPWCTKRVYDPGYYLGRGRASDGRPLSCVFGVAELPKGEAFRFEVRPAECYGKEGAPLRSEELKM
jgi:predicted phosphodiesterase